MSRSKPRPPLVIWMGQPPAHYPATVLTETTVKAGDCLKAVEIDFWRKPTRHLDPQEPAVEYYETSLDAWWRLVFVGTYFDPPEVATVDEVRDGELGLVRHVTAVRQLGRYYPQGKCLNVDGGFECIYRLDLAPAEVVKRLAEIEQRRQERK